jgi:hypothetical protein
LFVLRLLVQAAAATTASAAHAAATTAASAKARAVHRTFTITQASAIRAALLHALGHTIDLLLGQNTIRDSRIERGLIYSLHESRQVGLGNPVRERNFAQAGSVRDQSRDLINAQADFGGKSLHPVGVQGTLPDQAAQLTALKQRGCRGCIRRGLLGLSKSGADAQNAQTQNQRQHYKYCLFHGCISFFYVPGPLP